MKKICIFILALALLLAGCGYRDNHPEWDESWTRFEDPRAAETPAGWILYEYNPTLSMGGIWYATWARGEERMVTNAEGEEAAAYDAQIYLLIKDCGSEDEAKANLADWIDREARSYQAGEPFERSVGGQSYSMLPLNAASADNPYSHGAAAFAVRGKLAISVEALCVDGFESEAQSILEQFLSGIHYGE